MVALLEPRHAAAPGAGTGGGTGGDHQGAGSVPILPPGADIAEGATLPTFTPERAAEVAGGAAAVVVHLYGERHRRRVFLTLAAAERAVRRAEDAGHQAHIVLSRIVPIGVVA